MISVRGECRDCRGAGGHFDPPVGISWWRHCGLCGGTGRGWIPGGPAFGCVITLADRDPGEIVTLGNGQRAKIAWHQPRKSKKVKPETTFLLEVDDFTDTEIARPIPVPSICGVLSVDVARAHVDRDAHDGEKTEDANDPVQRTLAGRLI